MTEATTAPTANDNQEKRRRALTIFAVIIVAVAIGYGLYWFFISRYREYTDDAYVAGNLIQVSAQTAGTVVSIGADDTDLVKRGDILIKLGSNDANVALQRATADLGEAVRQVHKLFISTQQYAAGVTLGEIGLQRAQADLQRREGMAEPGAISQEDVQHAHETTSFSEAGLLLAQAQLDASRALTANTDVVKHPQVQAAAARLRDAYLAMHRTAIPSPVTGYVAKRAVQVGQHINAGETLMALFPMEEVWIDANFKEVQLRHLRIGQTVKLIADIYGDDIEYRGTVVGLGLGTGAAFSLLPAQNATGNWIKVVQRVPVRIALQPEELKKHPLRIGLSMAVTVDTHQRDGSVLATTPRNAVAYSTDVYDNELHAADALIASTIAANLGSSASQTQQSLPKQTLQKTARHTRHK
ncbi:MAG TPA: efflux RND transporter periplasmic adaptor subunit [Spongiibacteraceae bacterium]|nr:efflux RND transporter periplasmic adaptor subunit [Spongiibacteraceae bacterium]